MAESRWDVLQRLFSALLASPASERESLLIDINRADPSLGAELVALLHAAESPANPLDTSPVTGPGQSSSADRRFTAGMRVGAYELVRLIGEGGMGWVWLAQRTDGAMKRTVALKLPKWSWTLPDVAARLARERDILASLEHANIARFTRWRGRDLAGLPGDGVCGGPTHRCLLPGGAAHRRRAAALILQVTRRGPVCASQPGRASRPEAKQHLWGPPHGTSSPRLRHRRAARRGRRRRGQTSSGTRMLTPAGTPPRNRSAAACHDPADVFSSASSCTNCWPGLIPSCPAPGAGGSDAATFAASLESIRHTAPAPRLDRARGATACAAISTRC